MFVEERFVNNSQFPDSQTVLQRKISKQKFTSEQSNGAQMFSSNPYSTSSEFRHSVNSRILHDDNDVILTNDFDHQTFHRPNTRKVTKITPKENQSLTNNRPAPTRSASVSSALTTKIESKNSALTPSDIQRLKNVRRHEPAHVPSGPASKKSLITPDSWKTYPVVIKKPPNKKPVTETVTKPIKIHHQPAKTIVEQQTIEKKPQTEKPKREKSASKPSSTEQISSKNPPPAEQAPPKKLPKPEKTKEEREKIKKYIQEKRDEHEKIVSNEKQLKVLQEKERKEKLKKLNEQIKKVAQQPLPPSLIKKSSSTQLISKDHTEQTRERMLHLLGPRITSEPPTEFHRNTPFEQPALLLERSSSSSSSSSDSIVEIQPPKINQTIIRAQSEPPIENGIEQRHQNLLRWAMNLTRDCNTVEDKIKYLRPDGTQPFDLIPASRQNLQHDDGNLRSPIPFVIKNNKKTEQEPKVPSKLLRPSGRLSHLNQNHPSEYENQQLPGVGNLRDPQLERRVKRDRAATKIQATYRGYTVRKSLQWINQKQQQLNSEFNKRPIHKPTKKSYTTDVFDTPALNLDVRFSDDNFTIGSTLLRNYQRNGIKITSSPNPPIIEQPKPKIQQQKIQRPSSIQTYSDEFENATSTRSSTPIKQKTIPEKPRVIQQPISNIKSTSSRTISSTSSSTPSSSTSTTPTPTPEPYVSPKVQRRRSISPPLPPPMSPDNGRPVYRQTSPRLTSAPPPPPPTTTTNVRRTHDERRYSPDALERQLNAELHLLDGVEASMKQIENMERLRSVALAQQEVVSLAQILKNKPPTDTVPQQQQQQIRQSTVRQISSTSSSTSSSPKPKRRSPSPTSTSSSSESILTAREKRLRQKFHNEKELQAYEKRLKDVEQKIRLLVKRDNDIDYQPLESIPKANEIFDEKKSRNPPKSSNDSSISEDIPISHKSTSSISSAIQRKITNDISEIHTETNQKDSDSSTISTVHENKADTITTDISDIERRIRDYNKQLSTRKTELEKLKLRKSKDALRRQEEELKKQLQSYDYEIENLRRQPTPTKVIPTPTKKSPIKKDSSSSSSSSTTSSIHTKQQESSIAEELPASSTTSQSKTDVHVNLINEKRIEPQRPTVIKKERNFFDDDEEEEQKPKKLELKPSLETPRDERDTQHDAQSLSIATDITASSETDEDDSRRPSIDNEKSILNFNKNPPETLKSKEDVTSSSSSSSTTPTTKSEKSLKNPIQRKPSPIANDYDEDFSEEFSQSPTPPPPPPLQPTAKPKIDDIDVESIQEDIFDKQPSHDTSHSLSSKSSADEQSEILVLVKKSANNTPRRQDDKTLEDGLLPPSPRPPPPPPIVLTPEPKLEPLNNDDTSHDVSEDEEINEQENKVDKLTDSFIRTFIDEAIVQGKEIERLKKENQQKKSTLTPEVKEWMSEDESTDEDNPKQIDNEPNEFSIDLSGLNEKNPDEPRIESPRKPIVEEPIKPFVPHSNEQVIDLCHQALRILLEQNNNFSNRSNIQCRIPNSYFTYDEQDADTEEVRQGRRAYCQMIFDLCVELLHEMDSENVQLPEHPEWQKSKLTFKRFYRMKPTNNRQELEQIITKKILEILNLNMRQITYSKYRVSNGRRGIEKYEAVLDEEIRHTESQWINYDEDCTQIKFDIADLIFDQIVQETLTECLQVVNQRLFTNSNSTRL